LGQTIGEKEEKQVAAVFLLKKSELGGKGHPDKERGVVEGRGKIFRAGLYEGLKVPSTEERNFWRKKAMSAGSRRGGSRQKGKTTQKKKKTVAPPRTVDIREISHKNNG